MQNDDLIELYVLLTAEEMQKIAETAFQHGVSAGEFITFCVRSCAFGVLHAVSMCPSLGRIGTKDEQG